MCAYLRLSIERRPIDTIHTLYAPPTAKIHKKTTMHSGIFYVSSASVYRLRTVVPIRSPCISWVQHFGSILTGKRILHKLKWNRIKLRRDGYGWATVGAARSTFRMHKFALFAYRFCLLLLYLLCCVHICWCVAHFDAGKMPHSKHPSTNIDFEYIGRLQISYHVRCMCTI